MKKTIALISLASLISLSVGCSNSDIETLNNEIKEKDSKIEELNQELSDTVDKYKNMINAYKSELEDRDDKIEQLENSKDSEEVSLNKLINKDYVEVEFKKPLRIGDISLGDKIDKVKQTLGQNYVTSEWNYYDNEVHEKWIYPDGTEILFLVDKVYGIKINSDKYKSNFGINVSDSAINAMDLSKILFTEFVSTHNDDSKPNLGWYTTNNDELIILYFNKSNDRFNENVKINEDTKVEMIEILYNSSFD